LSIAPEVSNLEPGVFWVGMPKQATGAIWPNFMAIEASLPKPLITPNSTSKPAAGCSSPILHRTARSRPEPAQPGCRRQDSAIEPPSLQISQAISASNGWRCVKYKAPASAPSPTTPNKHSPQGSPA